MILKQYIIADVLIPDPSVVIPEAYHIYVIILKDRNVSGPVLRAVILRLSFLLPSIDRDGSHANQRNHAPDIQTLALAESF